MTHPGSTEVPKTNWRTQTTPESTDRCVEKRQEVAVNRRGSQTIFREESRSHGMPGVPPVRLDCALVYPGELT